MNPFLHLIKLRSFRHLNHPNVFHEWIACALFCLSLVFVATASATPKEPPCRIKRTRVDIVSDCQTKANTTQPTLRMNCFHRCLRPYSKDTFIDPTSEHRSTYNKNTSHSASDHRNTYNKETPHSTHTHRRAKPRMPQAQLNSEIWGSNTSVHSLLPRQLHSHNSLVQQCFQRYAVPVPDLLWMWVRFDVTTHGVRRVRAECHQISNQKLRRCLLCAVSSLPLKAKKRPWRVAQSIALYPNPYDGRSSMALFRWKTPVPSHLRAGLRQICQIGRRHLYANPRTLDPFAARPCKKGLQCCYPCGIDGCDHICLPRCPRGLP